MVTLNRSNGWLPRYLFNSVGEYNSKLSKTFEKALGVLAEELRRQEENKKTISKRSGEVKRNKKRKVRSSREEDRIRTTKGGDKY